MSEDNDEANLSMDWIEEYAQSSPNIAPSKRRTVLKDDDEEAVSVADAQYELEQAQARRGLEYLDDDPDAALAPAFVLQRDYNNMRRRTPDDAAAHDCYDANQELKSGTKNQQLTGVNNAISRKLFP